MTTLQTRERERLQLLELERLEKEAAAAGQYHPPVQGEPDSGSAIPRQDSEQAQQLEIEAEERRSEEAAAAKKARERGRVSLIDCMVLPCRLW